VSTARSHSVTMSIFLTLNKVLGVYALILTILGTLLNFFNFFVCMRLRKNTTFVFLSFFSLANAFSLYWWNLNNFLKEFVNIDLLAVSLWTCKIGNYVQFNSLQMAAWFLVRLTKQLNQKLKIRQLPQRKT
jgi:hypothetical protein